MEGFLAENVQNLQFLLIQEVGTVFNISFFLQILFFLGARNVWDHLAYDKGYNIPSLILTINTPPPIYDYCILGHKHCF